MEYNKIKQIYQLPLLQLLYDARNIHKQYFMDQIEQCQLISIKTGGCPEDCAYCSQSNHNDAKIETNPLMPLHKVEAIIILAKHNGTQRICLGAAYKTPSTSALDKVCEYVKLIKKHNLEACATLGTINKNQAKKLKESGLDYYNHNIDTSPEYYSQIITTHSFADRLATIKHVGESGIKICCGGIIGLGESMEDRISFIHALTNLPYQPSSIPINTFVKTDGVRLKNIPDLDKLELVRTIATIRIIFPQTRIRLSAGRNELTNLEQTTCFMAGANSIFNGEKLLTVNNRAINDDKHLFASLGLNNG